MPCMSPSCAPKRTSARRHSRILIDAFLRDDPSHFYPFRAPFLHSTAALCVKRHSYGGVDDWRIVYELKVEQVGNIEAIAHYGADTRAASLVTPRYRG